MGDTLKIKIDKDFFENMTEEERKKYRYELDHPPFEENHIKICELFGINHENLERKRIPFCCGNVAIASAGLFDPFYYDNELTTFTKRYLEKTKNVSYSVFLSPDSPHLAQYIPLAITLTEKVDFRTEHNRNELEKQGFDVALSGASENEWQELFEIVIFNRFLSLMNAEARAEEAEARALEAEARAREDIQAEHEATTQTKAIIKPKKYKLPTTKLSRLLHTLGECTDQEIRVSPEKAKQLATISVSISYEGENFKLNRYEIAVINAVATLFEAGNTEVTSQDIARATSGFTESEFITISKREEIEKIIDKAIDTKIKIEFKQHLLMNNKGKESSQISTCEAKLIEARKIKDTFGERTETAYMLLLTPPLYQYANAVGQVQSIPPEQYNTKNKLDSTNKNIILKNYLFERIGGMKSSKLSKTMIYETISNECQVKIKDRTEKKRFRTAVMKLLDHFIETNYIKSYQENKEGKSIVSITVKL